jgi:hypothetical protein
MTIVSAAAKIIHGASTMIVLVIPQSLAAPYLQHLQSLVTAHQVAMPQR